MTTWITRPGHHHWIEHMLWFTFVDDPRSGSAFDCDADGNVDLDKLTPIGRNSYDQCLTGSVDGKAVYGGTIVSSDRSYYEPGTLLCQCGAHHDLARGDSQCDNCGQLYNAGGQRLVPQHMWEESLYED